MPELSTPPEKTYSLLKFIGNSSGMGADNSAKYNFVDDEYSSFTFEASILPVSSKVPSLYFFKVYFLVETPPNIPVVKVYDLPFNSDKYAFHT